MLLNQELLAPVLIGLEALFIVKIAGALKPQVQQYPKPIKGVLYAKELLSFKRSGTSPDTGLP